MTTSAVLAPLHRLRAMDRAELRFRVTCEARKATGRIRSTLARPVWRREDLAALLAPGDGSSAAFADARAALQRGDWIAAHHALAAHFADRPARFPLDPRVLDTLASRVARAFPAAASGAALTANRIVSGRYDILGYRDVPFGTPPRWHHDPVHDREAPFAFWSMVPYLEPRTGDHKIIWEINRHQHWLSLARAHHLTGDRRYYREFVAQLEDWIQANPPLHGVNWASMLELAFRALSWLWALHFFAGAARQDGNDESPWIVDLLLALDRQLTHVEHNLSHYFSPNTHLSGEALGLYVAGQSLPELRGSGRRAAEGRRVLMEESTRQVRADGGHAELSAHYHRYSTDFYLLATLLARVSGDRGAPEFEHAARRQARYLRTIADDRGQLPLLGDDDGGQLFPICGRAPSDCRDTLAAASAVLGEPALAVGAIPEEVFWLCGSVLQLEDMPRAASPWPSAALDASGYYVSRSAAGDHLVFDAGPHGFLNGGHAHSDTLSIVLTVGGRPLLVDPGTASYTIDPQLRDRFRSTAMHNTVVLDGRPQSQPRGPFHWRSRANGRRTVWQSTHRFDYMEGVHDGYAPLGHVRGTLAIRGFGWLVLDHVIGSGDVQADTFWHVHPEWTEAVIPVASGCSGIPVASGSSRTVILKGSGCSGIPVASGCSGIPVASGFSRTVILKGSGCGVTLRHRDGATQAIVSSANLQVLTTEEAAGLDAFAGVYGRVERALCLRDRTAGPAPRSVLTYIPATAEVANRITVQPVPISTSAGDEWHCAAFRITWPGGEALLLAAVERTLVSVSGAAPGRVWGCADAATDGRVAFLDLRGSRAPIVIGGVRLDSAATSAAGLIGASS